jgi:hypothetical protein
MPKPISHAEMIAWLRGDIHEPSGATVKWRSILPPSPETPR